jgi:hypothetical protein
VNLHLTQEDGEARGEGADEHHAEVFGEAHPTCEDCHACLCTGALEACEGGCCAGFAAVGFAYDGHEWCEGSCADEARATLAEDIARDMFVRKAVAS